MNPLIEKLQLIYGFENPQDIKPVTEFDWAANGVDHKYIICITPRSGSTWLAHLLEATGEFGNPKELFIPEMIPANEQNSKGNFPNLFARRIKSNTSGRTFGFESNQSRLEWLTSVVDFDEVFVKSGTRFISLYREDLLSQAISITKAIRTGQWHSRNKNPHDAKMAAAKPEIVIEDDFLWRWILNLQQEECRWENFYDRYNIKPMRIMYEDMVSGSRVQMLRMMNHIKPGRFEDATQARDILGSIQDKTAKLADEFTQKTWSDFYLKYYEELESLYRLRTRMDTTDMVYHLNRKYGLKVTVAP
ncbi:Stf0 family sulfotransferase [Granulosicoccaceae sp. 1_MG-2023]|nr:Stf0 family sulfotransferase [Granulosicoccaceae sp. 1_MG-2023]